MKSLKMTDEYKLSSVSEKYQELLNAIDANSVLLTHHLEQQYKKLRIVRLLSENILVFLLQYMACTMNLLSSHYFIVSLATGTSCAFIFLRGYTILPAIWFGCFSAFYSMMGYFLWSLSVATLYTGQAWLLLILSYRFINPSLIFYRTFTFFKFVFATSALTAFFSYILIYCYTLFFSNNALSFIFWLETWLANLTGIFILSVSLITWDAFFPHLNNLAQLKNPLWMLGLMMLVLILTNSIYPPLFILMFIFTVPFSLFISLSYGWCGIVCMSFIIGMYFNLSAYLDLPPFSKNLSATAFLFLQFILCLDTILGLSMAILYKNEAKKLNQI